MTLHRDAAQPPPYRAAFGAGLAVFVLYCVTLAPTTQFWDTSEYIATAHILGIPHQPGNPLFVLLARAWDIILSPLGLPVAVGINLFSAFVSATAHGLWYLVVARILEQFDAGKAFRHVGAGLAVLLSATAFTVWNQSNVNEKVYTVSLLTIALITWTVFQWRAHQGRPGNDRRLLLIVFLLALSVGNHLMAFLATPAVVAYVAVVDAKAFLRWRLYAIGAVLVVVGLSVHLFLPIRAELDPWINEATPSCESIPEALTSILTWGQTGCADLSASLTRSQYEKPPTLPRLAPLTHQLGNYLQYFDWQWARGLEFKNVLFATARLPFTVLFLGLGLFGAGQHFKRERASWVYVTALFGTLSLGLVFYLNFKYGYSFPEALGRPGAHEVRERDYFFIVGFSVWGLWAGIGLASVWRLIAERGMGLKVASPVLALALLPLLLNWGSASRSGDYAARDWAFNLLMSVEPYGILFTNGDNDTFPLWYLQEVEEIRQDVTVIVTSYLNTEWYARQLRDRTRPCAAGVDPADTPTLARCQRPFLTPDGSAADVAAPVGSIMELDDATLVAVSRNLPVIREDTPYTAGSVDAVLPGGQYLDPWMQYTLGILAASVGQRPIYFASSGNAPEALGLQGQLVRQGLAFRLIESNPDSMAAELGWVDTRNTRNTAVVGPFVDYERTAALADRVFIHRNGLPEWSSWPDHSTIGVPHYYAWVYLALAQAAGARGDVDASDRYARLAERWTRLGS